METTIIMILTGLIIFLLSVQLIILSDIRENTRQWELQQQDTKK